ncbi:hypothetical protein CHUAL_011373 [Chamberlinius hualienensis]
MKLMKYFSFTSLLLLFSNGCRVYDDKYDAYPVISSLKSPVAVAFSSKIGSDGFLLAEQIGLIWCIYCNGHHSKKLVLNLSHNVLTSSAEMDQRGLLGMVLDPQFITNGYIYVFYSQKTNKLNHDHDSVISRFNSTLSLEGDTFLKFDPNSEKEILRISQPKATQNGGQLFFGPIDGYLYISTGDGGDKKLNRFDRYSLLGKILRLDVRGNSSIPPDNPFVGDPSFRPEIFAYGFRNPWRCAVDKRWIICGDAGESGDKDEIDVVVKGGQYGWIDHKIAKCTSIQQCQKNDLNVSNGLHIPAHSYLQLGGQAVVGGLIYEGNRFPKLKGRYIYADYIQGTFHTLELNVDNIWVKSTDLCVDIVSNVKNVKKMFVTGLSETPNGEIYILANSGMINNQETGAIYTLSLPNYASIFVCEIRILLLSFAIIWITNFIQ